MKIRKGWLASAALAAVLGLTGCTQPAVLTQTSEPTATPDPFHVDVQVPYVTQAPEATMEIDMSGEGSYVAISSDGKVTVLNEGWIETGVADTNVGYYTQLREGDSGPEVVSLQTRLQELGYYAAQVSGTFDAATRDALMQFEARYSDQCFGVATVRIQQLLYSDLAATAGEDVSEEQVQMGNQLQDNAEEGYAELKFGDESESVLLLQNRLTELGYFAGVPNGTYDHYTMLAVMRFEAAYGRELTGVATVSMQEYMYSESAREMNGEGDKCKYGWFIPMKKGEEGAAVYLLQMRLSDLGYADDAPNGKYNTFTEELLKVFQKNALLDATGKADEETLERLYAEDAPRAE